MADSTTNIDTISQSQASKEVTANAFFDAASLATLYGRRASTSAGLTWGYYGGHPTKSDSTIATISNGIISLTASTTNYIVATKSTGVVSYSTSNTDWNDNVNYWRLYSVVTGTATITSYTDCRELGKMTGSGGSALTVKEEGTNLTTAATSIDFVGTGVTATNTGSAVTVTIPSSALTVKEEGTNLTTAATSINFVGAGVVATNTGAAVTVTIDSAPEEVIEYADLAAFPGTGASGILYIAANTNLIYRWTGSAYTVISPSTSGGEVLEYANLAAFPGTGVTNTVYIAANTNLSYRWTGSAYVTIGDGGGGGGGQMLGSAATKAIFYNSQTIGENLTLLTGTNGLSAGPIAISDGYSVTIENGAVWTIV